VTDRRGCLLGKTTADKYGIKVGDRINLEGTFGLVTWSCMWPDFIKALRMIEISFSIKNI